MPYFVKDAEFELDPEEFVEECTEEDIKELVSILKETYPEHLSPNYYNLSLGEQEFELMINSLHGKWNMLSAEEEEFIRKVAKKFL